MEEIKSTQDFDSKVLKSSLPVLVDFFAPWCGPCRYVTPVVEEISKERAGKLEVYKLDVDQVRDIAARYGIQSIPTLIIFKNGEIVSQQIGAMDKNTMLQWIDQTLA